MSDLIKIGLAIIGGILLLIAGVFGYRKLKENGKFSTAVKKHKEAIIKKVRGEHEKQKKNEGAMCEITLAPETSPDAQTGL